LILLPIKKPRRWETNTRNSAFMPWKACRNSWSSRLLRRAAQRVTEAKAVRRAK
jgi:hypothetical protein